MATPSVRSRLAWLPNTLTMARVALAPAILAILIVAAQSANALASPWTPFAAAFLALAGLLDWLDGRIARALQVESAFGRFWDPVADKLVIAAALIGGAIALGGVAFIVPAALLLGRDAMVTWLRTQPSSAAATAAPSRLAKWKTALEYAALVALFSSGVVAAGVNAAAPGIFTNALTAVAAAGIATLWFACALSLATGWRYLRLAGKNFIKR